MDSEYGGGLMKLLKLTQATEKDPDKKTLREVAATRLRARVEQRAYNPAWSVFYSQERITVAGMASDLSIYINNKLR